MRKIMVFGAVLAICAVGLFAGCGGGYHVSGGYSSIYRTRHHVHHHPHHYHHHHGHCRY